MDSHDITWYLVEGINPQPWQASEGQIGRKAGKLFIHFHKPETLRSYQEAVSETFKKQNPQAVEVEGDISLTFAFWRQLEEGESYATNRKTRSNIADATNLQKAMEDALQGILFANDRQVRSVRSVIMEQGQLTEPAILVGVQSFHSDDTIVTAYLQRTTLAAEVEEPHNDNIRSFNVEDTF